MDKKKLDEERMTIGAGGFKERISELELQEARRRRIEEKLLESEEKFSKVFQNSPNLIVISTIDDGRIVDINDAGLKILGFTRDELIGKTSIELKIATPESRKEMVTALRRDGFVTNIERTILGKGGREIVCLFFGNTITIGGSEFLIQTIVDITERKKYEDMLRSTVRGISAMTGSEFFKSVVQHLATAFHVHFAMVGVIEPADPGKVHSLAVWRNDRLIANFEYCLANTPCENVIGKDVCIYPEAVSEKFPRDESLKEHGVESYMGLPLFGSNGKALGLLVVMDTKPFVPTMIPHVQSMLIIVAARTAAEIERMRTHEELREATGHLQTEHEQLKAKHIALREVLDHLERKKMGYRSTVGTGVKEIFMPYINKLKKQDGRLSEKDMELLEFQIKDMADEAVGHMDDKLATLTPRELDICECIKAGMTSKEIAQKYNISIHTIHKHRESIRKKLDLNNQDVDLAAFLKYK